MICIQSRGWGRIEMGFLSLILLKKVLHFRSTFFIISTSFLWLKKTPNLFTIQLPAGP